MSISIHVTDLTEKIHQVTRAHHLRSALSSLSDKLALARVGILHADLISSRAFGRMLRRINKALPANSASLPHFRPGQIQPYRQNQTCESQGRLPYPVLYSALAYPACIQHYRFFPYQVPLPGHNLSLSYVPDEPNYLIVSQNQQKYIQPRDSEIEICILDDHPFCHLHEPAYSTAGADSCLVALFRQDTSLTRNIVLRSYTRPTMPRMPITYQTVNGSLSPIHRPTSPSSTLPAQRPKPCKTQVRRP